MMIKLMIIMAGLFFFGCPAWPENETNKIPPVAVAASVAPSVAQGGAMDGMKRASQTSAVATATMADKPPEQAEGNGVAADGAQLRDPFWPIGFFPASISGGASRPAASEHGKENGGQNSDLTAMLRIGGVVKKGSKFYATVNGFTVQTGEVVSVVADGEVYKFIVERIDFNKVQFKPVKR